MHQNEQLKMALNAFQAGEFTSAACLCEEILAARPDHLQALHLSGIVAYRQGNMALARQLLVKAGKSGDPDASILNDLGLVYLAENNLAQAKTCFEMALAAAPNRAEVHNNLGLTLKKLHDWDGARKAFLRAVDIRPDYAKAFFFLGDLYLTLEDFGTARDFFRKAVQLAPAYQAARNHLAISYMEDRDYAAAEEELFNACKIDPDCAETWCNLGNVQRKTHRFQEALESYRRAITLKPDFAEARFNQALVLLLLGDFNAGWDAYEWRLKMFPADSGYPRRYGLPLWQGQDLAGKTILVYDEQGFGDTFMFSRYLAPLKKLGARVVFEVRPVLLSLFSRLDSADVVVPRGNGSPEAETCDCCVPLCSLAGRFFHSGASFMPDTPYLRAGVEKSHQWSGRFDPDRFNIGLVWSGSGIDPSRRCTPELFEPLSGLDRITVYSLQKDESPKQAWQIPWAIPLGPELVDFSDTAAVLSHLDLVISIDTAVAHLGGAMGKPAWVLLPHVPDWRWFLKRSDSPWYPTMRLFRQERPGDWKAPVSQMLSVLQSVLAGLD